MDSGEYDARIAMVPGYRAPRRIVKKSVWPGRLLKLVIAIVVVVLVPMGAVFVLSRDRIIATLDRPEDYHPLAITRLKAPTGEVVAEIAGARRRVLPRDKVPPALAAAVVHQLEPGYLERPALTQLDFARALVGRLKGQRTTPRLTLHLVRSLEATPSDDVVRYVKEWQTAIRLESRIDRGALVHIALNQLAFGGGVFGVEEGARAHFGRTATALDMSQIDALAELADRSDADSAPAKLAFDAPGCGALAAAKLRERYEADELMHLGGEVVTPCEPALSKAITAAFSKAKLDKQGLAASVVVIRLPGQELVAAVGDSSTARAIGAMRAPFVVAAALATLKWTMITPLEPEGPPLHVVALRAPLEAADGLMSAGLSASGLADLATKLGVVSPLDPEALSHGTATVTPIELASALAAIAEAGQHRMLQVLRAIDDTAESEGAKAALPVLIPEVAYLTAQLMQSWKAPVPAKTKHGDGAWTTVVSPDAVVLVWVGFPDGKPLPDSGEAERASQAIARDVQAAALKKGVRPFNRPRGLIARRVDPLGKVLPQTMAGGVEEWFAPGSVPRDED